MYSLYYSFGKMYIIICIIEQFYVKNNTTHTPTKNNRRMTKNRLLLSRHIINYGESFASKSKHLPAREGTSRFTTEHFSLIKGQFTEVNWPLCVVKLFFFCGSAAIPYQQQGFRRGDKSCVFPSRPYSEGLLRVDSEFQKLFALSHSGSTPLPIPETQ